MANVVKQTERLFVMMALDAIGLTATIEWVHISWRSILSIIAGPSTCSAKSALASVSKAPAMPQSRKIAVAVAR